jgi:hypothetical protein
VRSVGAVSFFFSSSAAVGGASSLPRTPPRRPGPRPQSAPPRPALCHARTPRRAMGGSTHRGLGMVCGGEEQWVERWRKELEKKNAVCACERGRAVIPSSSTLLFLKILRHETSTTARTRARTLPHTTHTRREARFQTVVLPPAGGPRRARLEKGGKRAAGVFFCRGPRSLCLQAQREGLTHSGLFPSVRRAR